MSRIDSEPELINLISSVEPSLETSTCKSRNCNSSNCDSSNCDSSNCDSSNCDSSNSTSSTSSSQSKIYLLVVDDNPRCYFRDLDKARETAYNSISKMFSTETDRAYMSEWVTETTLIVRSYPKFSPTRYDRIDSIAEIVEVDEYN
jgi:hypothetical protein